MKLIKHDKNIIKTSFSMALPSMLEMFFVSLAGLIDTLMVSSLGSDSVAAVGLTNQPKFISMSVFMALNVSVSALVARRFGEKKRMDANTVFTTAFAFMLVMCVIISFVMVYFADFIIDKTVLRTKEVVKKQLKESDASAPNDFYKIMRG